MRGGDWNVKDFNKVWINKASLSLFTEDALGHYARRLSKSKINSLQAQWNQVRKALKEGSNGFIGPFTNYITNSDNSIFIHEYQIMFLGKNERGYRFFLRVTSDYSHRKTIIKNPDKDVPFPLARLSIREIEISELIAKGMITKVIANKLSLSERTVENHRANIRKKLQLTPRTPLTKYLSTLIPR